MRPILVSYVWKAVEAIPNAQLFELSDHDLTDWIVQKVIEDNLLSNLEIEMAKVYINSRLTLIRDMALLEAT